MQATDAEGRRMQHFHALDHHQQREAILRLSLSGMSDHGIARATGLSVEMIYRLLADPGAPRVTREGASVPTTLTRRTT